MKILIMSLLVKLISFFPWIYIVVFYTYVLRVSLDIGRLPSYDNPDPSNLYNSHRDLINYSFELGFWGTTIGLIIMFSFYKKIFIDKNKNFLFFFFFGVLILLYNIFLDPLDTWYLD